LVSVSTKSQPNLDTYQDLQFVSSSVSNRLLIVEFNRKLSTGDTSSDKVNLFVYVINYLPFFIDNQSYGIN